MVRMNHHAKYLAQTQRSFRSKLIVLTGTHNWPIALHSRCNVHPPDTSLPHGQIQTHSDWESDVAIERPPLTVRSTSVLFIVGPNCTLAASHAASQWITVSMPTGHTDGRTLEPYIALSTMEAASLITVALWLACELPYRTLSSVSRALTLTTSRLQIRRMPQPIAPELKLGHESTILTRSGQVAGSESDPRFDWVFIDSTDCSEQQLLRGQPAT